MPLITHEERNGRNDELGRDAARQHYDSVTPPTTEEVAELKRREQERETK